MNVRGTLKLDKAAMGAYLLALVVWIAVSYAAVFIAWNEGRFFFHPDLEFIDFVYFYAGGRLVHEAPFAQANPYDVAEFTASVAAALAPYQPQGRFSLEYPPISLPFLSLLGYFTLDQAFLVWSALSLTCLVVAVWLAVKDAGGGRKARLAFIAGALASNPVWAVLRIGQTSLFVTLLVALGFILLRRRPIGSGVATALCLFKPQFAAPVAIAGFLHGGRRYLYGLIASLAGLFFLSLWEVPWHSPATFVHSVYRTESESSLYTHLVPRWMQNLRGELVLLTDSDSGWVTVVVWAALLVAVAALIYGWARIYPRLRRSPSAENAAFNLFMVLSIMTILLFSPHGYSYDYSLLAAALPFLWFAVAAECVPARLRSSIRGLILALPVVSWAPGYLPALQHGVRVHALFFWTLFLFVATLFVVHRMLKAVEQTSFEVE